MTARFQTRLWKPRYRLLLNSRHLCIKLLKRASKAWSKGELSATRETSFANPLPSASSECLNFRRYLYSFSRRKKFLTSVQSIRLSSKICLKSQIFKMQPRKRLLLNFSTGRSIAIVRFPCLSQNQQKITSRLSFNEAVSGAIGLGAAKVCFFK